MRDASVSFSFPTALKKRNVPTGKSERMVTSILSTQTRRLAGSDSLGRRAISTDSNGLAGAFFDVPRPVLRALLALRDTLDIAYSLWSYSSSFTSFTDDGPANGGRRFFCKARMDA